MVDVDSHLWISPSWTACFNSKLMINYFHTNTLLTIFVTHALEFSVSYGLAQS